MVTRPPGQGLGFDAELSKRTHDEIIDLGLERLYRRGLKRGIKSVKGIGADFRPEVLAGRVSEKILEHSSSEDARLIVLGRWGLHRESQSPAGPNVLSWPDRRDQTYWWWGPMQ
jgi:hypothetical protein